jgi:hypothetical protein
LSSKIDRDPESTYGLTPPTAATLLTAVVHQMLANWRYRRRVQHIDRLRPITVSLRLPEADLCIQQEAPLPFKLLSVPLDLSIGS